MRSRRRSTRATASHAPSPIAANISSKERPERLVDDARAAFGKIDILVCNAASNPYYGPMAGISDDQFRKILDNNVIANHWLIGFVAPEMKERQGRRDHHRLLDRRPQGQCDHRRLQHLQGRRFLSSRATSPSSSAPDNVRVNCIAPGLIKTDFAKALWENPETLKAANARTPLGRIGEPDEIAGAAVFLASKAGAYMTGQTIVIDGGATIT